MIREEHTVEVVGVMRKVGAETVSILAEEDSGVTQDWVKVHVRPHKTSINGASTLDAKWNWDANDGADYGNWDKILCQNVTQVYIFCIDTFLLNSCYLL